MVREYGKTSYTAQQKKELKSSMETAEQVILRFLIFQIEEGKTTVYVVSSTICGIETCAALA